MRQTARRLAATACGLVLFVGLVAACGDDDESGESGSEAAEQEANLTPAERQAALQNLDDVKTALGALDTAYASGNTAEAQTHLDEATASWDKVASVISEREAREIQLLFDSLGEKLDNGDPASDISDTVKGMTEELDSDIARELGG